MYQEMIDETFILTQSAVSIGVLSFFSFVPI